MIWLAKCLKIKWITKYNVSVQMLTFFLIECKICDKVLKILNNALRDPNYNKNENKNVWISRKSKSKKQSKA